MFVVSVEYNARLNPDLLDKELEAIAGKKSCSSGCFLVSDPPVRDIQWQFKTLKQAKTVAEAMRKVEGITSVVWHEA